MTGDIPLITSPQPGLIGTHPLPSCLFAVLIRGHPTQGEIRGASSSPVQTEVALLAKRIQVTHLWLIFAKWQLRLFECPRNSRGILPLCHRPMAAHTSATQSEGPCE